MFVGSIEANSKVRPVIVENLTALVHCAAQKDVEFVLRDCVASDKKQIPIDLIVYEALTTYSAAHPNMLSARNLTIIYQPGISSGLTRELPHSSFSASTGYRADFYREILPLTDIVVGVGGQHGLMRISMICEWMHKPVFLLPGSGGTSDLLWGDFFTKFHQLRYFDEASLTALRKTPLVNVRGHNYAEATFDCVTLVNKIVSGSGVRRELVTLDNVDLGELKHLLQRLSLGAWLVIASGLVSLGSIFYYLGTRKALEFLRPW
jgi:hypothetical protein